MSLGGAVSQRPSSALCLAADVTVVADNDSSCSAAALSEQRDAGRALVPSAVCVFLALNCNIQQDIKRTPMLVFSLAGFTVRWRC